MSDWIFLTETTAAITNPHKLRSCSLFPLQIRKWILETQKDSLLALLRRTCIPSDHGCKYNPHKLRSSSLFPLQIRKWILGTQKESLLALLRRTCIPLKTTTAITILISFAHVVFSRYKYVSEFWGNKRESLLALLRRTCIPSRPRLQLQSS